MPSDWADEAAKAVEEWQRETFCDEKMCPEFLETMARIIRRNMPADIAAERERCAKVCERLEAEETASNGFTTINSGRYDTAAAEIRKGSPVTPAQP